MARDRIVAIIPARAGSKGIPRKNVKLIGGRPLIEWVMAAALSSSRIDEVVLATDDDDAAQIGRNLGATVFARSAESASDEAPTEAVLMEVAQAIVADVYVLLQPTSPLTSACDVDAALAVLDEGHDSVLSVVPQTRFTWAQGPSGWTPTNYSVAARPRRQETEPFLVENGAIYAFR
ncbi:MAG TPA: acylneuraminate cytidylyltransferase family protein, partial [Candidatus Acidoferrum sp.]|nr:acylneuraminate cytidylyltransferase family protein [Candidatus Acidoferrum sp.]